MLQSSARLDGAQMVAIDGKTANKSGAFYPGVDVATTIQAGVLSACPQHLFSLFLFLVFEFSLLFFFFNLTFD
jgi:hypothetical protein